MRASCADGPCAAAPARSLLTPWAPQPCVCAAGSMHAVRWRGSRCLGLGGGGGAAAEPRGGALVAAETVPLSQYVGWQVL